MDKKKILLQVLAVIATAILASIPTLDPAISLMVGQFVSSFR